MPFVTEEVWSWFESGSVHRAGWPDGASLRLDDADPLVFQVAADVLAAVRKEKSEQKRSLMTPVDRVHGARHRGTFGRARPAPSRISARRARSSSLTTETGTELRVEVELAPPERVTIPS